ncbi:MAG: DUF4129 domain-containing protein [Actinobacteria bacterium]|nr:DUF4129 domain-containing protein [Actinomycetota bacterium]
MEVSSRIRGAALTALGILAALGVVAIASRGSTPSNEGRSSNAADVLLDVLFALYLVGILLGAVLLLYMLYLRRKFQHAGTLGRRSVLQSVVGMAIFLGAALFLARRLAGRDPAVPPEVTDIVFPGDTAPQVTTTSIEPVAATPFAWIPVIVTISLLAIAALGWWWSDRWRKDARGELRRPVLAEALATAVDESLDDLRAEPDPRKAVIAAYARLESVLARHGLPRRSSEAPLEYLRRMLAGVAVTAEAARRLTALFERAKFSQHEVGVEMKEEALQALEIVRDDLRAARAEAEHERQLLVGMSREGASR